MLSGRGIDGELKSKFGEWSEKFWKSSSGESPIQAKKFQTIYFANEGGGSSGEGEKLSELKGGDGKQVVSAESGEGDKVKKFFGICVGGGNGGSGCKENNNNASVVLVGSDLDTTVTWEGLKNGEWGDQTSLVRSRHSYEGLFKGKIWKGKISKDGSKFNALKLQTFLKNHKNKNGMGEVLCPLVPEGQRRNGQLSLLKNHCNSFWSGKSANQETNLTNFLKSSSGEEYFNSHIWEEYGTGWQFLALISLMDLWSSDLMQVNFDGIEKIFNHNEKGFKLAPFMDDKGKILYLQQSSAGGENNLSKITYHSGGMWTVQLCPNNKGCSNGNGLNLTVGDGKFCISEFICFNPSDLKGSYQSLKSHWKELDGGGGALWSIVFGSSKTQNYLQRLIIALVVACFNSPEDVVVSVQRPSKEGQLIFKLIEGKK